MTQATQAVVSSSPAAFQDVAVTREIFVPGGIADVFDFVAGEDVLPKILTGYVGNEGQLSMLRGETQATMDGAETSLQLVHKGDGKLLLQFGKELPDVPDGADLAENDDARKITSLLVAQSVLARICAGPPGIPADRLAYLREVYLKTLASPELLEDAKRAKRTIKPMRGEEVTVAIQRAINQPDDVVKLLKGLVTTIE